MTQFYLCVLVYWKPFNSDNSRVIKEKTLIWIFCFRCETKNALNIFVSGVELRPDWKHLELKTMACWKYKVLCLYVICDILLITFNLREMEFVDIGLKKPRGMPCNLSFNLENKTKREKYSNIARIAIRE